ncbi:MAG: hypothetical protein FWF04_02245, partial [Clostridiales bacterium]|nr:hypothetical protein [Clostridiales bacterium]
MQDLYKFLTTKCKERGIKIEGLPERFGYKYSRTTIYRYMKGILHITKDVQDLFVQLLNLNSAEQAQFAKLISLSSFDETMLAARRRLDNFFFESKDIPYRTTEKECVFYDQDKYLRTIDEIFSMILSLAEYDCFYCEVQIIGCTQGEILEHVADFTQKLLSLSNAAYIEHLATLSEADFLQNTVFLLDILPLLIHGAYNVYYRESATDDGVKTLLGDSLLITCQYKEDDTLKKKYYALSFLENSMPECIAFDNKYLQSFWMKNYAHLRQYYPNRLTHMSDLSIIKDELQKLEAKHDEYLIKPNPCYHKIPIAVYRRVINRIPPEGIRNIATVLVNYEVTDDLEARHIADAMLSSLEKRIRCSYLHKHIDVYSKEGLSEFAKTGRITDHLKALPPFDKDEVREALMYLRDRNRDPEDSYRLYLVNRLQHRYYFVVL